MRAGHWILPGVCVASLLAAACGSGGGGGGGTTGPGPVVVTTPPPTTPPATSPPTTVAPSPSPTDAPTFQFTAVALSVDGCTANGSADSTGSSSVRRVTLVVTFHLRNKDGQVIHSADVSASGNRWIYRGPSVKNGTYTLQVEARQSSQLVDRQASGSATARTCG